VNKKFKILLLYPNDPLLGIAPSNLAVLAAYVKQHSIDFKLFDTTIYKKSDKEAECDIRAKLGHVIKTNINDYMQPKDADVYDDFVKTVNEYKPDLIGIHVIDSTIKYALSFIEKIKDFGIPVISGGIGSTFNYERILKSGLVQYACISEGEEALVELCNKLKAKEDTSNIKNIYTIKDNIVIKNPLRPLIDINTLPPADFTIYEE
jgi:radical SAM superfamily enzyme YgiQ (UPF0313 family)